MKILIAVLISMLVIIAIPVSVKNCSGNSFLNIGKNIFSALDPVAVTMAYAAALDADHRRCEVAVEKTPVIHKWQDASGTWHYTDVTRHSQQGNNQTLPVDPDLYKTNTVDTPEVEHWLPYALVGFWLGLSCIFYLLMTGFEVAWRHFHAEEEETTVYQMRQTAGEAVEFFSTSPYEILGVNDKATITEVEAAYERQLSRYHKQERNTDDRHKINIKTLDDRRQKLLLLHQAYEAIKRKNDDKFLATV